MSDVIDILTGVDEGSPVDRLRRRRPVTREHAQGSWEALFQPQVLGTVPLKDRYALALFVTGVSGDKAASGFYRAGLLREGGGHWAALIDQAIEAGTTRGPYGRYDTQESLAAESVEGLHFRVAETLRPRLGERLSAALDQAHLLVFRPRESSQAALKTLTDAGWSVTDVVTLSQLVAFLTFQLRVIAGLRILKEATR
jgi:CMD domain protein